LVGPNRAAIFIGAGLQLGHRRIHKERLIQQVGLEAENFLKLGVRELGVDREGGRIPASAANSNRRR